jgi:hypothetical protein
MVWVSEKAQTFVSVDERGMSTGKDASATGKAQQVGLDTASIHHRLWSAGYYLSF